MWGWVIVDCVCIRLLWYHEKRVIASGGKRGDDREGNCRYVHSLIQNVNLNAYNQKICLVQNLYVRNVMSILILQSPFLCRYMPGDFGFFITLRNCAAVQFFCYTTISTATQKPHMWIVFVCLNWVWMQRCIHEDHEIPAQMLLNIWGGSNKKMELINLMLIPKFDYNLDSRCKIYV